MMNRRTALETSMKKFALTLVALIFLFVAIPVKAQSAESIWIAASTTSFKTGETVRIEETAPISKLKTWKVIDRVTAGKTAAVEADV